VSRNMPDGPLTIPWSVWGHKHPDSPAGDGTGAIQVAFFALTSRAVARAAGTLGSLIAASAVSAQPSISTNSAIFVEQQGAGNSRVLEPASNLSRGDRVVTVVTWHRMGGDGGFVITNPMPRMIAYEASARDDQEVSVDGGKSWGQLEALSVGSRQATPEDVTHVRWRIPAPVAAKGRGQIAYSGVVR
jgi:hypothetical protein